MSDPPGLSPVSPRGPPGGSLTPQYQCRYVTRTFSEIYAPFACGLASPALLAIPIARAVRRHRDSQVRGACAAIVIASCALMATTSVRLAPEAAPSLQFALLAGAGFIALISGRVPPVIVILVSACLGLLLA